MEISSCRYHDRENYEVGNSEGYCGTNGDYPPILGKGTGACDTFGEKFRSTLSDMWIDVDSTVKSVYWE